jgi:guanine nucleotide-binding protein subunit beta-2-like 1 protein
MGEPLAFKGSLAGHSNWITAVATSSENPDMILTASRGMLLSRKDGRKD